MSAFTSWQMARRAQGATVVLLLLFAVLGGAFFKAQVLDHQKYRVESAGNRFRQIPLEAPRGAILDRNGLVIADNIPGYSIKLIVNNEDSLRAVLGRLAALVPSDSVDIETVVKRWKWATYQPALVFASGQYPVVATLEEHRALLPGLLIQREPRREYPSGAGVGHLVGYVSQINQMQLDSGWFAGAQPGEIVGQQGLEIEYDSILRGRRGVRYAEVTAGGRTVRDRPASGSLPPVPGHDLKTTIDLPLQEFIDSMWRTDLPNRRGAMVALKPDGEILAYYSYPDFDPNAFVGGIDATTYTSLLDDANRPLYNRVIQGTYPPASPFKLAIAAMALRRGLVTMDSKMPEPCRGEYQFGNRVWKCYDHAGHGALTLREAIAESCDIYFYQLGLMLGGDAILQDGTEMGFGDRSGVDLPNESRPRFNSSVKSYVDSRGVSTWSKGEVLNLAIGQGHNAQTLINMATFYAALASDGVKREPYLVTPAVPTPGKDLGLTQDQLAGLRDAMIAVVKSGTATAGLVHETGARDYEIAGKTGSGQVTGQQDLAWFMSFAPASDPKIVVGIQVEEGIHGGLIAKYAVRAIARYLGGKATKLDVANITEDFTQPADTSHPDSTKAPPHPGTRP
ncbi:MAG TPA: penicillin-binding protein 2 [Gemmatimonadales bacterium]|jgi:penicillin-binding protein 2|nr:penicillin-binding protein 2 [Gemmatimonadales bacterium]